MTESISRKELCGYLSLLRRQLAGQSLFPAPNVIFLNSRALCLWLLADGEKERKAFLRYGKGDTGFYFLKNFSNGYAAAGLPCQMMIERTAVEENHIRGREQRLPCKLSAQKR